MSTPAFVEIDSIMGPRRLPAPQMTLPDKTSIHCWSRLLAASRRLGAGGYKTKRAEADDRVQVGILALVLANAVGMAPPFWVMEAERLCTVTIEVPRGR